MSLPLPLLLVTIFLSTSIIAPSSLVVNALSSQSSLRPVQDPVATHGGENDEWENDCDDEGCDDWHEGCDGPECQEKLLALQDECDNDDCDYEYFYEEGEDEDEESEEQMQSWTPLQVLEMEALYERYCDSLADRFGPDWEDEFELVEDMETIYQRYLDFQEKKRAEVEEREKIQESHRALRSQKAEERVQKDRNTDLHTPEFSVASFIIDYDSMYLDVRGNDSLQTQPYIKNETETDSSYGDEQEPCSSTLVTIRKGSTQSVVGSI